MQCLLSKIEFPAFSEQQKEGRLLLSRGAHFKMNYKVYLQMYLMENFSQRANYALTSLYCTFNTFQKLISNKKKQILPEKKFLQNCLTSRITSRDRLKSLHAA